MVVRARLPAPLTRWGQSYYNFWYETGVLMRRDPHLFNMWTNGYVPRGGSRGLGTNREAGAMFAIMWEVLVLQRYPRFFSMFDPSGIGKVHAMSNFRRGWNSAYELGNMAVRMYWGMPEGSTDVRPYKTRFMRLLTTYARMDPYETERAWYRRGGRVRT